MPTKPSPFFCIMKYINQNRIGAVGVFACVILGGFEFFEAYLGGISRLDLNTPLSKVKIMNKM
jgi:hypothetical protein